MVADHQGDEHQGGINISLIGFALPSLSRHGSDYAEYSRTFASSACAETVMVCQGVRRQTHVLVSLEPKHQQKGGFYVSF
jgi:hypothetical protein